MMNTQNQLEQIDVSIDQALEAVELGKALDRLHNNPDFIKVVKEGYFKDEAVRLVMAKGNPALAQHQDLINKSIDSISIFSNYLQDIWRVADTAQEAINENESLRDEILRGEV